MNFFWRYLLLIFITATTVTWTAAAVDLGAAPPEFGLPSNRGRTIKLSEFRGRVLLIDFWASWCSSCRHSLPWLEQMQQQFGPEQFQVIAINVDTDRDQAEKFLKKIGVSLLVAFDPEGQTPETYSVKAMPTSVLVSADGTIAYIHEGFSSSDSSSLEQKIKQLVKKLGDKSI